MPDQTLPQEQLQDLIGLFGQGRLQDAITKAEALTDQFPTSPQLHNIIGAAQAGLRQYDKALASYRRSIEIDPQYAEAHNNLGVTLYGMRRPEEAVEFYRVALRLKPRHADALSNLGAALIDLDRADEARDALEHSLRIRPDNEKALRNLGVALRRLGRLDDAIGAFRRAVEIAPASAEAHNGLGAALLADGQIPAAMQSLEAALRIAPTHAEALNNLGNVLVRTGNPKAAIERYRQAIDARPDHADAHANLSSALAGLGQFDDAHAAGEAALRIAPRSVAAWHAKGQALAGMGQRQQAVDAFQAALRIQPDHAETHNSLGVVLNELGHGDQALAHYEQAVAARPGFANALFNLAQLKRLPLEGSEVAGMRDLAMSPHCTPDDRALVHFALGKAFDDAGDAPQAFKNFARANTLRKASLGYDISQERPVFDRIKALFSSGLPDPSPSAETGQTPVFIVGMPRSGTTLVEQILASHRQIHGAGELPFLKEAVNAATATGAVPPAQQFDRIGTQYRAALAALGVAEPFVTDKMPLNLIWIGFIRYALPEARIIHVKRDARATCWSIFRNNFSATGNGYGYDLSDVAEYYALYADMMAFWNARFPGLVHDVSYEDLTENPEPVARGMVGHLGLDWDPQCLEFHRNTRAVKTVSVNQVRQELYTGSSEAWRRYAPFLGPMVKRLEGL